ncbi:hypothetical protein AgCh_037025 [Apium graveolens]
MAVVLLLVSMLAIPRDVEVRKQARCVKSENLKIGPSDILVGSSAKYILCYTSEWINKVPALKSTQVHSCDYLVTKLLIYR